MFGRNAENAGVAGSVGVEDFRLDYVPARLKKLGDFWKPLLAAKGRVKLEKYL